MSAVDLVLLVVVAMLVALTGMLGAAETVLTRLGLVRALALDEDGRGGARHLLWLIEHPAQGLNVVMLLTVTARVAAAAALTVLVIRWGVGAVTVAGGALVVVSFVAAEVAPRSYALRHLERVGVVLAAPVAWTARVLEPVVRLLVAVGSAVSGRSTSGPFSSDEGLRRLMATDEPREGMGIEEDERAMIRSIFELGDTVCREIMVPRPDMVTVSSDESLGGVVELAVACGYSRIPVWEGERDRVVGVIYAKDLLERLHAVTRAVTEGRSREEAWADLVRDPTFVPESKRADDLLRELQQQQIHLAIVVDEHGAIVGLVTIEDILEEIVGEIVDEYDREEPPVMRLDDRRLRVSARLTVHDLNELLGAELPEDEGWDTVGGLIMGMLGRVPQPGESVRVDSVVLVAERVQGRRISKVLVTLAENEEAGGGST